MNLSSTQREVLIALLNRYQLSESPISSGELADVVERKPGTIRNQMQALTASNLVEGVFGPEGGYKPTSKAYTVLGRQKLDVVETLPLTRDYNRVDLIVNNIDFTNVHHPEKCRARIEFQQSISQLNADDPIIIGPTPYKNLVLAGVIRAIDNSTNELQLDITQLKAPLRSSQ